MKRPLQFALTGGPGTGKTTLLAELARRGFAIAPESGRAVVRDHPEFATPDRTADQRRRFAALVLERDRRTLEWARQREDPVIFDRTGVDAVAGEAGAEALALAAAVRLVQPVALLPVWPAIFGTDAERRWTLAQARAIEASVRDAYRSLGHRLVAVPFATVEARADWVMALWNL